MKKILNNKVVQIGITTFCVMAACILFTFFLLRIGKVFAALQAFTKILMPLIFGYQSEEKIGRAHV